MRKVFLLLLALVLVAVPMVAGAANSTGEELGGDLSGNGAQGVGEEGRKLGHYDEKDKSPMPVTAEVAKEVPIKKELVHQKPFIDENNYKKITINERNIEIVKNGVKEGITMDVEPYITKDRAMMPIRYIGDFLGYKVDWDQATKTATIQNQVRKIQLTLGAEEALVDDDMVYSLDAPVALKNDRIMAPVGLIARLMNLKENIDFYWDNEEKALYFFETCESCQC